jgi:hypothetical protein
MKKILSALPEELKQYLPDKPAAEGMAYLEVPAERVKDFLEAGEALIEAGDGSVLVVTTPEMLDRFEGFQKGQGELALLQDKLTAADRENELLLSRIAELEANPEKKGVGKNENRKSIACCHRKS